MNEFILSQNEILNLNKVLESVNTKIVTFKNYLNEMSCDKYDCFFRGVQCPCEGICDGRA